MELPMELGTTFLFLKAPFKLLSDHDKHWASDSLCGITKWLRSLKSFEGLTIFLELNHINPIFPPSWKVIMASKFMLHHPDVSIVPQRELFIKRLNWERLDIFRGFHLKSMTKSSCEKSNGLWLVKCKFASETRLFLEGSQVHLNGQEHIMRRKIYWLLDIAWKDSRMANGITRNHHLAYWAAFNSGQ